MPDLTSEMLDRIASRAKAATPGPYKACGDKGDDEMSCSCRTVYSVSEDAGVLEALFAGDGSEDHKPTLPQAKANARYFASVSPDVVLAMVEEIRMHREYRAKVTEGLVACRRELDHLTREMGR